MVNNLTLGIPQSGANPLLNYFDQTDEMAEQHRRAMEKWRQENIAKIDRAVLEPEAFFAENPVPAFDPDPQAARDSLIVASYLALHNDGKPVTGAVYPEIFRDRIAQERFGGRGAGSDQAFLAEIRAEAQGRRDSANLFRQIAETAATGALLRAASPAGIDSKSFDLWREEAKGKPGYQPGMDFAYREAWNETQAAMKENLEPYLGPLSQVWDSMQSGGMDWFDAYDKVPAANREQFLASLALLVRSQPAEQQPGLWEKIVKTNSRAWTTAAIDTLDGTGGALDWYAQNNIGTPAETPEQTIARQAAEANDRKRRNFVDDITALRDEAYDPVKALGFGEKVATGIVSTIPLMASAAVPYAGTPMVFAQTERMLARDFRRDLMQGADGVSMSDEDATALADTLAPIVAAPYTAIERMQVMGLMGKFPALEKIMAATANRLKGTATRFTGRLAIAATAETVQENLQQALPAITQELASQLSAEVPGVVWKNGKDGFFDGYWEQTAVTFAVMLPLSIVAGAGGIQADQRARIFAQTPDVHLRALGISTDGVARIRAAQARGLYQAEQAIAQEVAALDPRSEDAKDATQEIAEAVQQEKEAMEQAQKSGVMPTFYRTADGWSVRDGETGAEIGTADTAGGALRLAMSHSAAIEEDNADQIAALATLLEAGDVVASTDWEGVRQTATDLRPGQVVTTAQQAAESEVDEARIRQQTEARERLGGGDGGTARLVLGQSVTETRQKVRNTVNRINAGGSVLTVFHEESHGFFREAIATGRLTREDAIAAIRALETALAGKTTRDGQQLRFLPDGDVTDTQLDEAVAELYEAEILRTRKTAGRSGTGTRSLPPGLITRNLTAMARLAPGATARFRDFIAAVRAFWGLTFARATAIKSAIREGTLDEQQLEDFKARLFGLQEQDDLEQAARDAEARILDGTEQAPALDGDPFSLAARPSITEDNAPAFSIAGPRAKGFQAAKEAGRTFTGRDGKERFELNTSDARFLGLMDVTKTGDTWVRPLVSLMDWPELFDNYPAARSITVEAVADLPSDVAGRFEMERNAILLSKDYPVAKQASFLLHELQHWIQNWENFAQGGSPEQFAAERARLRARMNGIETSEEYRTSLPIVDRLWNQFWENDAATEEDAKDLDAYILKEHASFRELRQIMAQLQELDDLKMSDLARYRALPGEIEARGVQARASMTAEERAASPFMESFSSFSIGRAVQLAKQTEKTAKIAEEDFFTTFWPRMMKLAGQNLKASTRNINEAAKRAVVDIGEWVKKNPKFQDYYSEDWKNTRAILDDTFEGFTDDLFKGFRLFTGLTSPSTPLDGNLADAVQIVNLWISRGSLLSLTLKKSEKGNRSVGPGPFPLRSNTGATKIFSLHVVEELFRRFGSWEQTVDFLNEPVSVKDLHAFNKEMGYAGSVGGIGNIRRVVMEATGQDEMIPRMFIFGQKVGAYTLNTLGDHRYTTTDIWESRFIRSYFPEMFKTSDGLPVNEDEHTIFQRFAGAFNKQFEAHYGIKLENSALQAIRWFYMLAHAKEAGYRHARTNQTISGYTLQAVRNYIGRASGNRGRGSRGSGGAEQGPSFSLGPAITPKQDAAYLAAVEAGDMEEAQRMVDEVMALRGYTRGASGKLQHQAPSAADATENGSSGHISLANLKNANFVPADYWTRPEWYLSDPSEFESHRQIKRSMEGARIRVFRTIPKTSKDEKIRNGDWVTPSRDYAIRSGYDENAPVKVISMMASPAELFWDGNSANELGFDDGKSYAYRNTKNNRKLADPVTYGYNEDGSRFVVPLSKRFNFREPNPAFSLGPAAADIVALAKEIAPAEFRDQLADNQAYIRRQAEEGMPLSPEMQGDQVTLAALFALSRRADSDPRARQMLEAANYGEDQFSAFSLGRDINSAAFKEWFAGSVVTTPDGSPLIVHHGSPDVRDILKSGFKPSPNRGQVYFFTDDFRTANTYADDRRALDYQNAEPHTLDVYLALKNPMEIDAMGRKWRDTEKHVQEAKAAGHDGIIIRNSRDEYNNTGDGGKPVTVFAVFSPEQITSAATNPITSRIDGINLGLPQFSLGPAKLAELLRKDAVARIKDPVRRTQVMSRIAREMEAARLELERLELVAGSKRLKKSLAREARIREVLRYQELENETMARWWQILSDDDLVKIKQQPAHKLLTDPSNPLRGRIQSRTEAIRRNPELYAFKDPAEYDGSEAVSRAVFGGSLTPDQAVEELVDAGLLKPGSKPDDLWQLLEAEARSVSNRKQDLALARQELREARQQAKDETNLWLREQGVVQETTFGDKQEILRALGVLDGILSAVPAEIRGKVGGYTQLARISTNEAKLAFLKDRLQRVDTELERWLKDQFDREFRALLDRAKPEKDEAGKKPRGKIGADVHELFAAVRESMTMTAAEVEAEAVALESLAASGDYTAAQESHLTLQANLIRLAGEWNKADAARREAALVEATRVFEAGYLAHKTETLRKREHRAKVRDALQQATGKAGTRTERRTRAIKDEGTKAGRALTTLFSLMSFEQVVERAFGRDSQEARDLVDWERRAAHAKTDAVQNKLDQLDDLFATLAGGKLKGEELRWKMSRPDAITIDGQTFSELEAITATLMWRQEDGRRHMTGHVDDQGKPSGEWNYTQDFIDRLEAELSDNAKAVRLHLAQQYAAEYDRLNAVFRDLNGVSLPRHKHYSPLTVKPVQSSAGQMLDPITGMAMSGSGFTPGSLKNRSQTAIAEPDFKDALQVYIAHAKQMEHWIAYAPFATEAMAILNAREIGNSVEAAAGKEALSVLRSWLDVFAQGGTRDAAAHLGLNRALNRITGRAAATALVGRVSVLAIQSTQLGAALAEMPLASYLSRLARLFAGRLDWSGALSSDYIQRRKAQMPPVVQQAMEGLTSSKPSRLKYAVRKLGETISGADALFTSGTFAIVLDYQLKQAKALGLSGAEAKAFALESAERATDRVAQPVRPGTRSLYEVTSVNPLARISWSFASDARQKLALSAYAIANRTPAEAARALAVTWIAGGVFASLIRAAMRDIRDDGEDDEIFDAENWDPKRLALSALTGPLAGIPALGDAVEAGLFAAFDEFLPEGNLISGVRSAFDSVGQLPKWLTGDRQGLDNALKDSEALMSGLGLASDSAAAVTSLLHVVRDLFGVARNVTD